MAAALAFATLAPTPAYADELTLMEAIASLPVADEIREGVQTGAVPALEGRRQKRLLGPAAVFASHV